MIGIQPNTAMLLAKLSLPWLWHIYGNNSKTALLDDAKHEKRERARELLVMQIRLIWAEFLINSE